MIRCKMEFDLARVYKPGQPIKSVAKFEEWINAGNKFVIVGSRTTHIGWYISWQYNYLSNTIKRGIMFEAVKINDNKEVEN